jgi:hypothetical protein
LSAATPLLVSGIVLLMLPLAARTSSVRAARCQSVSGLMRRTSSRRSEEQRALWKDEWRKFESDLWAAMEALGCSGSEIHRVKHIGAVQQLDSYPGTHPSALILKSRFIAQLNQLGAVSNMHDTTRPVSRT